MLKQNAPAEEKGVATEDGGGAAVCEDEREVSGRVAGSGNGANAQIANADHLVISQLDVNRTRV